MPPRKKQAPPVSADYYSAGTNVKKTVEVPVDHIDPESLITIEKVGRKKFAKKKVTRKKATRKKSSKKKR